MKQKAYKIHTMLKKIYPSVSSPLNHTTPFELLVAVILSAQCADTLVNKVTKYLFQKYKTVRDYAEAYQNELEQDIRSINFYKNKTKYIIATAGIIHKDYHDNVPQTMDELTQLPGVGRKTANVVLWQAFGINVGIAVDTHVARLAKQFGLTTQTDPQKIEQDLMNLIPQHEWGEFALRMVLYGREYSPAQRKKKNHFSPSLS